MSRSQVLQTFGSKKSCSFDAYFSLRFSPQLPHDEIGMLKYVPAWYLGLAFSYYENNYSQSCCKHIIGSKGTSQFKVLQAFRSIKFCSMNACLSFTCSNFACQIGSNLISCYHHLLICYNTYSQQYRAPYILPGHDAR